jgi:plastocyanin
MAAVMAVLVAPSCGSHIESSTPDGDDTTIDTPIGASTPAGAMQVVEVVIESREIHPDELVVPAGSTVRWVNNDESEHWLVSVDEGVLDSATIPPGGTFEHRFDAPGTVEYYCTIHNFMKGVITVE